MTQRGSGNSRGRAGRRAGPRRLLHIHETDFPPTTWTRRRRVLSPRCTGHWSSTRRATPRSSPTSRPPLGRGRNCLVLTRRVAHVETLPRSGRARTQGTRAAGRHDRHGPASHGRPARRRQSRRRRARHRDNTVHRRRIRRPGARHAVPRRPNLLRRATRPMRRTSDPRGPGKDVAEVHDYHDRATPILAASRTPHARIPHTRLHQGIAGRGHDPQLRVITGRASAPCVRARAASMDVACYVRGRDWAAQDTSWWRCGRRRDTARQPQAAISAASGRDGGASRGRDRRRRTGGPAGLGRRRRSRRR